MSDIQLHTNGLEHELYSSCNHAESILILTSFVMKSGVALLKPTLQQAAAEKKEIKICAGDYLYVTQPEALEELLHISPRLEIRLWRSRGRSFHPKAYLFSNEEDEGKMIIGSSNMSRSALTSGIEWNLSVPSSKAPATFNEAVEQFLYVFYHEQTVPLNRETLSTYKYNYERFHKEHPNFTKKWTEREEAGAMLPYTVPMDGSKEVSEKVSKYSTNHLVPRLAQKEALEALQSAQEEGYQKAMVVMATGLGKTYLAGFFAKPYKRVLFVAHREEILKQAQASFEQIYKDRTTGLFFASEKEREADFIFGSIFTLSLEKHLKSFNPYDFDLIIIDEFHHAAAKSYNNVIEYFNPKFLLGLTATPDRRDGKDVYALCDGNVAYQLHFLEAIRRGWLSPFHYVGIYDDTDYSQITWLGNRYDDEELLGAQMREETAGNIYQSWLKNKQTRTLAFCSSIKQANFLNKYFREKGIRSACVSSHTQDINRSEAIEKISDGSLDIIFSVDLFNEGTDIPSLDTLLFVRPTESLTIFTQQIGRGLRLSEDKDKCVVIDLIGNYRNADLKLSLIDTRTEEEKRKRKSDVLPVVPENCSVNFELKAIHLLEEFKKKRQPRKHILKETYLELKEEIGRRPTYLELHLQGARPSKEYKQEFKSYPGFLHWANELNNEEKEAFQKNREWFEEVEKTGMNKSYKMVLLKVMLDRGVQQWATPIAPEEAAYGFHKYLTEKEYRKKIDFSDKTTSKLSLFNEKDVASLIARMPMTKWAGSGKGLVLFEEGKFFVKINSPDNLIVYEWTKQIVEYRLHYYFERKDKLREGIIN
ncbi:DEAD/DEAH box helicase family protein [Bacillus sp. FJAT-44742]|uniref:DEAD/DEAH box helicase family protein n=1 Tax=Bacillus sp. FJAT-44742 TaxID=2014005 RepID=UPI000C24CD5D|nr:DEAD/DEAH box helicase family protein [Bacillus sp. FJAT-44742]